MTGENKAKVLSALPAYDFEFFYLIKQGVSINAQS